MALLFMYVISASTYDAEVLLVRSCAAMDRAGDRASRYGPRQNSHKGHACLGFSRQRPPRPAAWKCQSHALQPALPQTGIDVTIVRPGTRARWQPSSGVSVISVPAEQRWGLIRNYERWRSEVRGVLADLDPDVVHGHGIPVPGAAATQASSRARSVLTAHGSSTHDTTIGSARL